MRHPRKSVVPLLLGAGGACLVLLMTGCGNEERDVTFQPVKPEATTGAPAPPPAPPAFAPASPPASASDDPLAVPDQLASGADAPAAKSEDAPALAPDDQLADAAPKMPTDHSHWLRGGIFNARVAISLNGLPLGEFRAPLDKDITMKLRRGVNTVTFAYAPRADTSSAHLDVLESEHTPPIAPLASFRSPLPAVGKPQKPFTQTFTFLAR